MTQFGLGRVETSLLALAFRRKQGVDPSAIATKIGISLSEMARATRLLIESGYLVEREERFFLTKEGRDAIFADQEAFVFKGQRTWREVPGDFTSHSIPAWEPYAPRIRLLDPKFFRLHSSKMRLD